MGRPGCCTKYCNVEKLDKDTGAIIWRSSVPFDNDFAFATQIVALSDGSFVIAADASGLCRLSSDGETIIATCTDPLDVGSGFASSSSAFTDVAYSMNVAGQPFIALAVKPGAEYGYGTDGGYGSADVTDLIYVARKDRLTCYDAMFNIFWDRTSFPIVDALPTIAYHNNAIYCILRGDNRLQIYNALTGATIVAATSIDYGIYLNDAGPRGLLVFSTVRTPLTGGAYTAVRPVPFADPHLQVMQKIIWGRNGYVYGTSTDLTYGSTYTPTFCKFDPNDNFATLWSTPLGQHSDADFPVVSKVAELNDGGFALAGFYGWQPFCTMYPWPTRYGYVNAWCFNSDGTLRWSNPQFDELSTGADTPTIPRQDGQPPLQWNGVGINGMKAGVAVGPDGHPVFTSMMFRATARPTKLFCGNYGGACAGQCAYVAVNIAPPGYTGSNTGSPGQFVVWQQIYSDGTHTYPSCTSGCTCFPFVTPPAGILPIDVSIYSAYFDFCNLYGYPNLLGEVLYVNCS